MTTFRLVLLLAVGLPAAVPLAAQDTRSDDVARSVASEAPEEASPYHSLGDAYREAGRLREALRHYERAVELGERRGHEDLYFFRTKLEWWRREM